MTPPTEHRRSVFYTQLITGFHPMMIVSVEPVTTPVREINTSLFQELLSPGPVSPERLEEIEAIHEEVA